MKNGLLILCVTLLSFSFNSCSDEDENTVQIGTLLNNEVSSQFSPELFMTAFEEEFTEGFEAIDIDTVYFQIAPDNLIIGQGTIQYTDEDGSLVTSHIITKVPFTLEGSIIFLSAENMNAGESCSGNPCSQCSFEPHGAGCDCVSGVRCDHTITRLSHGKGHQGGFNNVFEC